LGGGVEGKRCHLKGGGLKSLTIPTEEELVYSISVVNLEEGLGRNWKGSDAAKATDSITVENTRSG